MAEFLGIVILVLFVYTIVGLYHGLIYLFASGFNLDECKEIWTWIFAWPYVWYRIFNDEDY